MKIKSYSSCIPDLVCRLLQISHKSEKGQWNHHHFFFFFDFAVFLCSKFHVSIIIHSGVKTFLVYKGLSRNTENGNTLIWVLLNIWRKGLVRNMKFGMIISDKKLLNSTKCHGYSFDCFQVINNKSYLKWRLVVNSIPKTWKKVEYFLDLGDSSNLVLLDHQLLKITIP